MTAQPHDGVGPLPSAGIRVLEFCHTIMGPLAGVLRADLGCGAIKVEPVDGDRTRRVAGFAFGVRGQAPHEGERTREVLAEAGYSVAEIDRPAATGAISHGAA